MRGPNWDSLYRWSFSQVESDMNSLSGMEQERSNYLSISTLNFFCFGADFKWGICLGVGREIIDKAVNGQKFEIWERSMIEQLMINMWYVDKYRN